MQAVGFWCTCRRSAGGAFVADAPCVCSLPLPVAAQVRGRDGAPVSTPLPPWVDTPDGRLIVRMLVTGIVESWELGHSYCRVCTHTHALDGHALDITQRGSVRMLSGIATLCDVTQTCFWPQAYIHYVLVHAEPVPACIQAAALLCDPRHPCASSAPACGHVNACRHARVCAARDSLDAILASATLREMLDTTLPRVSTSGEASVGRVSPLTHTLTHTLTRTHTRAMDELRAEIAALGHKL